MFRRALARQDTHHVTASGPACVRSIGGVRFVGNSPLLPAAPPHEAARNLDSYISTTDISTSGQEA